MKRRGVSGGDCVAVDLGFGMFDFVSLILLKCSGKGEYHLCFWDIALGIRCTLCWEEKIGFL